MTIYLGDFPAGKTIYVPFHTFDSNGASVTITGLAVTDIEIYRNGSVTQRASDAGYTLLDTDGIDFDGITGIHGFSIDTSDNTDAGFYAAGYDYWVVVSAITVDTQTVNFVAATFSIDNRQLLRPTVASRTLDVSAGGEAGIDWANVGSPTTTLNLSGTSTKALEPTTAGRTLDVTAGGNAGIDFDNIALTNGAGAVGIQASGTLSGTHSSTTADLGTNAPASDISGMTLEIPARVFSKLVTSYDTGTGVASFDSTSETLTNGDQWYLMMTPSSSSSLPVPATVAEIQQAALADLFNTDSGTDYASAVAGSVVKEIADNAGGSALTLADIADAVWDEATSGHATAGTTGKALSDILADTNELQADDYPTTLATLATAANLATVDNVVDAIKAKTDSLTFTVAGQVDANMQSINDTALAGDGGSGTEFDVV